MIGDFVAMATVLLAMYAMSKKQPKRNRGSQRRRRECSLRTPKFGNENY